MVIVRPTFGDKSVATGAELDRALNDSALIDLSNLTPAGVALIQSVTTGGGAAAPLTPSTTVSAQQAFTNMVAVAELLTAANFALVPGSTYDTTLTGVTPGTGAFVPANLSTYELDGHGATLNWDHTFTGTDIIYVWDVQNCAMVDIRNLNILAQIEPITPGDQDPAFRGPTSFLFRFGTKHIRMENIVQTGGRQCAYFEIFPGTPAAQEPICIDLGNIDCTDTHYVLEIEHGGAGARVRNVFGRRSERTLFLKNVIDFKSNVASIDYVANDVLIQCERFMSGLRNGSSDLCIPYRTLGPRQALFEPGSTVGITFRSDQVGANTGAFGTNLAFPLDMDCAADTTVSGSMPIVSFFATFRQFDSDGSYDGTLHNHIIANWLITGRVRNVISSFLLDFGIDQPFLSTDSISQICVEDLIVTGSSGATMQFSGTGFTSPLVFNNVQTPGSIILTNFAPGMLSFTNVQSFNINTIDTTTVVWTQASGTGPTIGNGTISAAISIQGDVMTSTITLIPGSTTTFGDGTAVWEFSLGGAYAAFVPRQNAIGSILAINGDGTSAVGVSKISATSSIIIGFAGSPGSQLGETHPFAWTASGGQAFLEIKTSWAF